MPKDTASQTPGQARLYRMVMEDHLCPFGLKAKSLLRRHGFEVDDRPLRSRAETDAFLAKAGVETTPQVYIGRERIGGYEDLRRHLGLRVKDEDATSYQPVIAIFATAFAMALAVGWLADGALIGIRTPEWFAAISMCLLGVQKLRDVEGFSNMFLGYDLLARRAVRYAYVYPFAETLAGVLMLAGALIWLAAPVSLFIGTVGAASVIKAVYIDRRDLVCACTGAGSNVPLGAVSLAENLVMAAMGLWMPARMLIWPA